MAKKDKVAARFAKLASVTGAPTKGAAHMAPKHQAPAGDKDLKEEPSGEAKAPKHQAAPGEEAKSLPKEDIVVATEDLTETPLVVPEKHEDDAPGSGAVGRIIAALAVVIATFCGIYVGGAYYFVDRFMPNTTLDGEDVSMMTIAEVAEGHGTETADYKLQVSGGDGFKVEVTAASVGMRSDGEAYAREALRQVNPWMWPAELLGRRDLTVDVGVTFDAKKLDQVVGDAVDAYNKKATDPVDAKIAYDEGSHRYQVVPEVVGTKIDRAKVVKLTSAAVSELETELSLDDAVLVQPAVTADDPKLNEAVDGVNASLEAEQVLKVGDEEVYTFDAELIARFSHVSDDYKLTMDGEALREWAQGELSDKLDSAGHPRSYTRPDGKYVSVNGGNYGWNIDGATVAQTIAENVEAGKAETFEVPMLSTADVWNPGGQDWGKRYIDIDLSEQYVRMYDDKGSLIWESPCVTGKADGEHETPTGVYYINDNKEQGNIRLEGREDKATGEPEYVSYVTYWMPFVWNAVALHDATWRYTFGGDVYVYDGSHGCVNLPYDKAEALFGITHVGDVVVSHY